jgi:hypothetical protein
VATVEVVPYVRGGEVLPITIGLIDPFLRAVVKRDSVKPSEQKPGFSSGLSFEWRQTLVR